jgi:hypothetical protein
MNVPSLVAFKIVASPIASPRTASASVEACDRRIKHIDDQLAVCYGFLGAVGLLGFGVILCAIYEASGWFWFQVL